MKYPTRWQVRAVVRDLARGGGDVAGLLDMMRYDGCTVYDWTPDGDAVVVRLEYAAGQRPELARWRSFGMVLKEVQ